MITVQADPRDLERILKRLDGLGTASRWAVRSAVNNTASAARRLLAQQAQRRYTVSSGGFNRHAAVRRATLSRPTAVITVQGGPLTLRRFHTTAPKTGVKAEVLRGGGLKELVNRAGNRAFPAAGRGGTKQVFQRTGRARYPLRALHGPSAAKMVETVYAGGRGAEAGLKEEIARLYRDSLQKQIDKAVGA